MKEIETYLKSLEMGGKSPATIRVYRKDLLKLQTYFNLSAISDLENLKTSDYYEFYNSFDGLSEESLNGLIRSISAFFSWLRNEKVSEAFEGVRFGANKFVKVPEKEKLLLTDEDLTSLIKAGRTLQEKTMICLMVFQGFRNATIRGIKLSDISDCSVTITLKGGKNITVSLHETACTMLHMYLAERKSDSPFLFFSERGEKSGKGMLLGTSVNNRIKSAAKRAGFDDEKIKKIHSHSTRHAFATNAVKQFGLNAAQNALNHKSINTTSRYYDLSTNFVQNEVIKNQRSLPVLENN